MEALLESKLSDDEKATISQIEVIILDLKDRFVQLAELLGKLSRPGLREAKRRFGFLLGPGHIERLYRAAHGEYPMHLAIKCKSISASDYQHLQASSKTILNDPDALVPIAVNSAEVEISKKVSELTLVELKQCFDQKYPKWVPLDVQRKALFSGDGISIEKHIQELPEIQEFRIGVGPGTPYLVFTINGQQQKIKYDLFWNQAKHFRRR